MTRSNRIEDCEQDCIYYERCRQFDFPTIKIDQDDLPCRLYYDTSNVRLNAGGSKRVYCVPA